MSMFKFHFGDKFLLASEYFSFYKVVFVKMKEKHQIHTKQLSFHSLQVLNYA